MFQSQRVSFLLSYYSCWQSYEGQMYYLTIFYTWMSFQTIRQTYTGRSTQTGYTRIYFFVSLALDSWLYKFSILLLSSLICITQGLCFVQSYSYLALSRVIYLALAYLIFSLCCSNPSTSAVFLLITPFNFSTYEIIVMYLFSNSDILCLRCQFYFYNLSTWAQ